MFPVNVSFFENVLHVVFVEVMSFDWYCAVSLLVVVNIMVSTMTL